MVPWDAARAPSAPYKASTMHCEVSTLPATTAAGGTGFSIDPGGTRIESGRRQPSLSGMSASISVRKTYSTAAVQTASGALKLPALWADVPAKSITAARAARSILTDTSIALPSSSS